MERFIFAVGPVSRVERSYSWVSWVCAHTVKLRTAAILLVFDSSPLLPSFPSVQKSSILLLDHQARRRLSASWLYLRTETKSAKFAD
jgi:hypothetical protein